MKPVWISVDVEGDISRYLSGSFRGIHFAMPRLLGVLKDSRVKADFFVLGSIAEAFPGCVREIVRTGHEVGSHSDKHDHLCELPFSTQLHRIESSIDALRRTTGREIDMLRAPNFSANGDTVRVLERTGIPCDSSVLPGRHARRRRLLTVYDHRGAPRVPYHPSTTSVDVVGSSSVLEIPVTENPLQPGTPIGLGFLNRESVERTLDAIERSSGPYAAFLVHPWEAVELPVREQRLPQWLAISCKSDLGPFEQLLAAISDRGSFATLKDIARSQGVRTP